MSTDTEHAHAFARDTTGLCRCGMTAEQYQLQQAVDNIAEDPSFKHKIIVLPPGPQSAADEQPEIVGQVIIAWPQRQVGGRSLNPGLTTFTDAQTGKLLPTINANLTFGFGGPEIRGEVLIAELTLFCSKDGDPLAADSSGRVDFSFGLDLEPLTAKFNYHVVEMRVGS